MTDKGRQRWKQRLTAPLVIIASLLMWIEETLWYWLKCLTSLIGGLNWVHHLEALVVTLPPYAMMAVFFLPMTILFPFKILAVYWLTRGQWLASLATIIAAKVLGTAIVARMYVVCKPKLLSIWWFKFLNDWVVSTRDWLHAALQSLPFYQAIKLRMLAIKRAFVELRNRLRRIRIRVRWRALWRRIIR